MTGVKSIFEPESVVLIGSSRIREKVGMTSPKMFDGVIYNMNKFFVGKTYVVDLEGNKGVKSIDELPKIPEMAVIMLPPNLAIEQAKICAQNGVKALVLLIGGCMVAQHQELLRLRKKFGIRILGPNTIMGVINTINGLNTIFHRDVMPLKGDIAVVSQSGGVGACLLDLACCQEIGVSKFAFVGDKIDIDDVDLLGYLSQDENTKVICLYMEGLKRGREFIEVAREIVRTKPILVIKGGVTREAARRAMSHTASLVGSDVIFDAAFKKAGVIRVDDIEQLLNSAVVLSKQPRLSGDNIAIISNVGGPAILAADAIVKNGLKLATLSEKTRLTIEKRFRGIEAVNPIDLIADARKERYSIALEAVLSDPNVDGVMVINMLKSCFFEPEDALVIAEIADKHEDKPVVDVPAGGEDFISVQKVLRKTRIPVYNLPEKAAEAMGTLRIHNKKRKPRDSDLV